MTLLNFSGKSDDQNYSVLLIFLIDYVFHTFHEEKKWQKKYVNAFRWTELNLSNYLSLSLCCNEVYSNASLTSIYVHNKKDKSTKSSNHKHAGLWMLQYFIIPYMFHYLVMIHVPKAQL